MSITERQADVTHFPVDKTPLVGAIGIEPSLIKSLEPDANLHKMQRAEK